VLTASSPRAAVSPPRPPRGFAAALLTSLVLVLLVGVRGQARGLLAAALAAAGVLLLHRATAGRAPWGWLALLVVVVEVGLPGADRSVVDPVLLVAFTLSTVLWLIERSAGAPSTATDQRPPPGSRGREAQELQGRSGELYVSTVLARELPQDFVVINGLNLPDAPGDIDHLVVGPTGVFVLETKTMAGLIVCHPDGSWQRTRRRRSGWHAAYIGDPATQVQRNIAAVRRWLRRRVPELCRDTPVWIEGLIVFPHPQTELDARYSRVPAVRLAEVAQMIRCHVPDRPLQPTEVDAVVGALLTQPERWAAKQPLAQPAAELA
jgi:hypothetical protein